MFDVELQKNEDIITIDYHAKVFTSKKMIEVLMVLTNLRILIYTDANKELDYMEVMRLVEAVKAIPNWEQIMELNIDYIKTIASEDENCILTTVNNDILKFNSSEIQKKIFNYIK